MSHWPFNFIRSPGQLFRSWSLILLCGTWITALTGVAEPGENARMGTENPAAYASLTNILGSWIWEKDTRDDQNSRFWQTFTIPAGSKVTKAVLVTTADNDFTLYLDGRAIGRGVEWREWYVFDPAALLPPGSHVLAMKCYNGAFAAGMLLGLHVELADGRTVDVRSDSSWRVVPEGLTGWETRSEAPATWASAVVVAPYGHFPWERILPDAVIALPSLQPLHIPFWQTLWFQIVVLSLFAGFVLVSLWLLVQLILHRKERLVVQQERKRIARDIHDDLGGRLTQVVVHVEVAQNELPEHPELRSQLSWVCQEIRGLLTTMDEVLWVVNPRCDTLSEFSDFVGNCAHEFLKPAQIQCFFEVTAALPPVPFPFPQRRSLLSAVKEALNNVLKHSGATEVQLKIAWQEPWLTVVIHDNGQGFDPARRDATRNGLTNLQQRLQELDGTCRLESQPGAGCTVELRLPLRRSLRSTWRRLWHSATHEAEPPANL